MDNIKIYKSKIGLELVIPIIIILGGTTVLFILKEAWPGLVINFVVMVFFWYTFVNTIYTIKDKRLFVRCGLFVNEVIKIETIRKVIETRNLISSAAASLDRLEILYNKYNSILISPKEKMEFIQHLQKLNPGIEIKFRNAKP